MFSFTLIPVINKITRVTKRSVSAIDHIITNSCLNANIQTGIIKTDISDHFPIFLVTNTPDIDEYPNTTTIYKRYINTETIQYFRSLLHDVVWEELQCPDEAYNSFLNKFQSIIYDQAFPEIEVKLKTKTLLSPVDKERIIKILTKHKLHDKYLKHRTYHNEIIYKNWTN